MTMFKGQPPGNGGVPPGDDSHGPAMQVPIIPPKRSFKIHRQNPETLVWEDIGIEAHEVEIGTSGLVLRFREFSLHPTEGPTNRVVKTINLLPGWEYEEVIIEQALITPVRFM